MAYSTSHKNIASLLAEKRLQREKLDHEIRVLELEELEAWASRFHEPTEQEDTQVDDDEGDEYDEQVPIRVRFTKKRKFEHTKEWEKVISVSFDRNDRGKESRAKAPTTRNIANRLQTTEFRDEIVAQHDDEDAEFQMERDEMISECYEMSNDHFNSLMNYCDEMAKAEVLEAKRRKKEKALEEQKNEEAFLEFVKYIEDREHRNMLLLQGDDEEDIEATLPKRMTKKIKAKKEHSCLRDLKIVKEKRSKRIRNRSRTHQHGDRDWSENKHIEESILADAEQDEEDAYYSDYNEYFAYQHEQQQMEEYYRQEEDEHELLCQRINTYLKYQMSKVYADLSYDSDQSSDDGVPDVDGLWDRPHRSVY